MNPQPFTTCVGSSSRRGDAAIVGCRCRPGTTSGNIPEHSYGVGSVNAHALVARGSRD
jgi:hypothetical protein